MTISIDTNGPAIALLDRALEIAGREEDARENWRFMLEQLEVRIRRNEERKNAEPKVPTLLQDEYRKEIDGVMLENMQLAAKLEQTRSALDRSKFAYTQEAEYSALLKGKLEELEQKLVNAIRRKTIN